MNEFGKVDRSGREVPAVQPVEKIPNKLPEKQPNTQNPETKQDTVEISEEAMELFRKKQAEENQSS